MVVADALEDLAQPGAGDFFGRIDEEGGPRWYVGRRHIEDEQHDPVVVDWRAAVAAPFYRATVHDPLGLRMRRRFTLAQGELTAYLDEHLDDPQAADVAGGIPDPVLAEIGAARTGEMREIVATIQAEQDHIIRAPLDRAVIVQGGPGTGKTAVGLHRAAYLLFEHRRQLSRDGVLVVGPNRVFLDYIANVLPSLGERSVQQRTVGDLAVPRVEVTAEDSVAAARVKGAAVMATVIERAALAQLTVPAEPMREPLGATAVVVEPAELAEVDRRRAGRQPAAQPTAGGRAGRRRAGAAPAHRSGRDLEPGPDHPRRAGPGVAGRAAPAAGRAAAVAPRGAGRRGRRPAHRRRAGAGPDPARSGQAVDAGRPGAPRHRQLVPQRPARHLRPRRGGRGAGPVRAGAGRRRPALPPRLADHPGRPRPVDRTPPASRRGTT